MINKSLRIKQKHLAFLNAQRKFHERKVILENAFRSKLVELLKDNDIKNFDESVNFMTSVVGDEFRMSANSLKYLILTHKEDDK